MLLPSHQKIAACSLNCSPPYGTLIFISGFGAAEAENSFREKETLFIQTETSKNWAWKKHGGSMTISALDIVSNSPNIEMVQLPTQRFYPCNGILILHYLKIILAPPQTGTSPIQIVLIKDTAQDARTPRV